MIDTTEAQRLKASCMVQETNTVLDKAYLGRLLRQRRLDCGLGVHESARRTKLSPSYLCDIESGRRSVTDLNLQKLLNTFAAEEQA